MEENSQSVKIAQEISRTFEDLNNLSKSYFVDEGSTSPKRITQTDVENWTGILGLRVPQASLSKTLQISKGSTQDVKIDALEKQLKALFALKEKLILYFETNGNGQKSKEDFARWLELNENGGIKKGMLRSLVYIFLAVMVVLLVLWCKKRPPSQVEGKSLQVLEYLVKVPAAGDSSSGSVMPWTLVRDSNGAPVLFHKDDTIVFDLGDAGIVSIGLKSGYDSCDVYGYDEKKFTDLDYEKHYKRQRFYLCPGCRLGSLVYHFGKSNFIDDRPNLFYATRFTGNKDTYAPVGPKYERFKLTEVSPYLYLAVNDVYLFGNEIDSLDAAGDTLLHSAAKILPAYKRKDYGYFYRDNGGEFSIKLRIFRRQSQ